MYEAATGKYRKKIWKYEGRLKKAEARLKKADMSLARNKREYRRQMYQVEFVEGNAERKAEETYATKLIDMTAGWKLGKRRWEERSGGRTSCFRAVR